MYGVQGGADEDEGGEVEGGMMEVAYRQEYTRAGLPKWVRATPQFRPASALVLGWLPALLACYAVFALLYMHASGDRVAWVLCILAGNVGEGMGEAWGARSRD